MHQARDFAPSSRQAMQLRICAHDLQVELTGLDWQRQAPDLDPGSFLVTSDGSNRLDPHGQTVVFVKEG